MKGLPEIYTLHNYAPAETVMVIGCGGTGAYTIANLARYISVLNGNGRNIGLILADGDIVEEKNLKRQHFISYDIGKNKAEALAERYSTAFGIEIAVIPKDIEAKEEMEILDGTNSTNTKLVISCVDNNASRKVVNEWFRSRVYYSKFWIDSGNEETAGQVVCGFAPSYSSYYGVVNPLAKEMTRRIGLFSLPTALEMYPDLNGEAKFNSQLSCAERAISAPQNSQTNVTAATLIMNFAQKAINGDLLTSCAVEFNINNTFTTKHNLKEILALTSPDRRASWEVQDG